MLHVITGGSGSGKSAYAERAAVECFRRSAGGGLYYVATMYPYDGECENRIARHREQRKGKGFATVECFLGLGQVQAGPGDVLLLECMSNLLANEMYEQGGGLRSQMLQEDPAGKSPEEESLTEEIREKWKIQAEQQLRRVILNPLLALAKRADSLIVVTNEVFSDGNLYGRETEQYRWLLGKTNCLMAERADSLTEVVCSCPVAVKGELPC